jgi:hypothetical protein
MLRKLIARFVMLGVLLSCLGFVISDTQAASAKVSCHTCYQGTPKGLWWYCAWEEPHSSTCSFPPPPESCFQTNPYCEPI